jgi:formamidopyrimidine-DNA glycosylase
MPELPEVEVLVRHLAPLLRGRTVRGVEVHRDKVVRPTAPRALAAQLAGATFVSVTRRAKYLVFHLRRGRAQPIRVIGHLGMTGRMFLQPARAALPRHAAVTLHLGRHRFVFEDTRYFGRFTLDTGVLAELGPEPLENGFDAEAFHAALRRSTQPIKVKLLDQTLVAGVGNIYASEALHVARISPRKSACRLTAAEAMRLHGAIRQVLAEAVRFGSTVPLEFGASGRQDGLFYYGRAADAPDYYAERLRVYDRAGKPCGECGAIIRRIVQAARSTYFCPRCQRA